MRAYHHQLLALVMLAGCAAPAAEPGPLAPWAWEMPRCVAYQPEEYAAPEHRVSASAGAEGVVTEVYEPGWGARAVDEIRAVVGICAHYEYGDLREQNMVVETGFAAEESLLVETVRLSPPAPVRTSYAAVVRDGDVVTTFRTSELGADETLCLAGAQLATCAEPRA